MKSFFGIKQGMLQIWTKSGLRLPVTVIKSNPMTVSQVKGKDSDGYTALQCNVGVKNPKEIRLMESATETVGTSIAIDQVIKVGQIVNVAGLTKGKGFSGVMKRWHFKGGPKTHGQSDRARAPGSIGQGTSPGRIHKGKKMAGQFGNVIFSTRNMQVIKVDSVNNEVWVNGPIPGGKNTLVEMTVTKDGNFEGIRE